MPEVALTLRDLLRSASERLRTSGAPGPTDEALRLWAGLQRTTPGAAWLAADREVDAERGREFDRAVERRVAGEPLAYVVGWTGFRHLKVRTDRRALIPRPETEGLVDLALDRQPTGWAADVGTGTGCIAVALATEGRFDEVHAVDLSPDALALAALNAEAAGAVVRFHQGDLVAPLRPGRFDLLVANPPYVSDGEHERLDPSVRDWEPALALRSGVDGLRHTRRLLDEGRGAVRAGGWMVLELDAARAAASAEVARGFGWTSVEVHHDLFGRDRYLTARRSED